MNERFYKTFMMKCPYCGRQKVFDATALKRGEVLQGYCQDFKLEFIVPTLLTESEQEFVDKVLELGVKEGMWVVDKYIAAGSGEASRAFGADFLIYGIKESQRRSLWIEFKRYTRFEFQLSQIMRFNTAEEQPWTATRFCGLLTDYLQNPSVRLLSYWTPSFFQCLPKDSFIAVDSKYKLQLLGLEDCFRANSFTTFASNYTGQLLDDLIRTPNLNIFEVLSGKLGDRLARYKKVELDRAYKILYEKLVWTMANVTEESSRKYLACIATPRTSDTYRQYGEDQIDALISESYRPLYQADLIDAFEQDAYLGENVPGWVDGVYEIEGVALTSIVNNYFKKAKREGWYEEIRIEGYSFVGYGVSGRKYIPLTRGGFLDFGLVKGGGEIAQ